MPNPHEATPQEMIDLVSGRRSDDPAWFDFGGTRLTPADVVEILGPRVAEQRKQLFESVLAERTENATVVIEGMVDLGNVGAVMRSVDGFGIQAVHAIDTAGTYKWSNRTAQGADKWIDRIRWEDAASCVAHLRHDGFTVVAADVSERARPLTEVDLTRRIAIVFGNELEGLSDAARSLADEHVTIPMSGFAESFNISVAAAVALAEVRRQRVARFGSNGDLSEARRDEIRAVWFMKTVRGSQLIVQRALEEGYRPAAT